MATEASGEVRLTVYQETSDGIQTRYPIRLDLGYLRREDIYIYQGEHADYETQLGYSWVNDQEFELDSPLADGEVFNVRRVVERDDMLYKFITSSLHPQNIDNAYLQLLMIAQELMDGFGDRDGLGNIKNVLDMRGYNIQNMADARDGFPQDAVTKGQLDTNYEYVLEAIRQLDQAVADASESAIEAGESAADAAQSAVEAKESADSVRINPQGGLSFADAGSPTPNDLQVDIGKEQEVPAAVANNYVLVLTDNGLYKVQVGNLVQSGSAYDVRGTVVLDNDANTGTVTDTVYNETYQITPTTNPNTNPEDGNAYTVTADAVNNGILGVVRDFEIGDIIMWANGSWNAVAVAVTTWQGKAGNVQVELGDVSSDVIHMYTNTGLSLSEVIQDFMITSVEANSSIDVPIVNTADRPDEVTHAGKAMMHYEPEARKVLLRNPLTGRWEGLGGGGAATLEVKDTNFTVEANTAYGIDISSGVAVIATIPDGLLDDSWVTIVDISNTFDSNTGCLIQLGTERFIVSDTETQFWHNKTNGAMTFQKKNGKWLLAESSYGQDATWAVDKIQNGFSDWVVIGEPGAPSYENGSSAFPSAIGLRYRFIDANTIHVIGSVSGSFNGNSTVFTFPTEIADRINDNQRSPVMGNLTGSVANLVFYSYVQPSGVFQIVEGATTGISDGAYVNHTIVLDT